MFEVSCSISSLVGRKFNIPVSPRNLRELSSLVSMKMVCGPFKRDRRLFF